VDRFGKALIAAVILSGAQACGGELEWRNWRGPNYNGSSQAEALPVTWSTWFFSKTLVWSGSLRGMGAGTPIISGDHVFLTAELPVSRELVATCLRRSNGRPLWRRSVGKGSQVLVSNMASPSPVTDGRAVYFMFGSGDLAAMDFDGNVLWSRNLAKEYGRFETRFGYGASPLLLGNKLYISVLQLDKEMPDPKEGEVAQASYFLAIDPKTGKNIWKHVRPTTAKDESQEAYTSPMPRAGQDGTEIVLVGGDCVTGHDAESGEELWRWQGYNTRYKRLGRIVPSAVVVDDLVIVCAPKHQPVYAIRPDGRGVLGDACVVWKHDHGPDAATPLLYRNVLYVLDDDGMRMKALDPKTGKKIWMGRLQSDHFFRASPTGADGKIYCINEGGEVFVLEAGRRFKLLAKTRMGGEKCWASISAVDQNLFVRAAGRLYCIGGGK